VKSHWTSCTTSIRGDGFEPSSYETTAYLDTETGTVIFVDDDSINQLEKLFPGEESLKAVESALKAITGLFDTDRQQMLDAARVEWDDNNRYLRIPKQDSRDGYQDMQGYIWSLEDDRLRELLEVAIQGSGAFRGFKDVLYRYPEAQEAQESWFKFLHAREQRRMVDWLASEDIEPGFE
jgi:hypothetical protein